MPLKYLLPIIALFIGGFFIAPTWAPVQAQGEWTQLHLENEQNYGWAVGAMSDTRQVILMGRDYGETSGLFHISTDAGTTWEFKGPSGYLLKAAMSATGQVILVGEDDYMGQLFISTNTGATWQTVDSPYGAWRSVAISDDGATMLAGSIQGLYRSVNGGADWTEIYPYGDPDYDEWWGAAISGNGQTMLATHGNLLGGEGHLHLSKDGGNNWEPVYSSEETPLLGGRSAAISQNGEVMIIGQCVTENSNHIWMSRDGGVTWEQSAVDPADCWLVSLSDTGERGLIAEGDEADGHDVRQPLYTEDFGETWHGTNVELPSNIFHSVVTSGDGNSFLVAGDHDYLWQFTYPPPSSGTGGPTARTHSSRPKPPACHDAKPPSTPDLFQIDVNNTQASLYFTPTLNADRFYISYGDGETVDQYGVEVVTGRRTGVIGYTINHLQPGQTYTFTVRSGNGCMPGNWSNTMTIATRRSSHGGTSYYKNFVARVLSYFPIPVDYMESTDQVLGATTTQTIALRCFSEPVQVDPPIYSYIPDPYGVKSMLQLIKLLRPKCSLVFPY